MKTEEEPKDYDHLEHFGLNQKPDGELDSNDTYALSNIEGHDSNDTYSHAQIGLYTDSCTSGQTGLTVDTYEHAKNMGYGDGDTYDHSHMTVTEVKGEMSDNVYAHAQNTDVTEEDYNHAGFDERNDNDTYE